MEKNTGLIFESWSRKDYSHELMFGAANVSDGPIRPLKRSIEGIPVIIQDGNSCVVCTVTWIRQFLSKEEGKQVHLSWPFLAEKAHLTPQGATPSQVLEPARKIGIAPWEAYEESLDLANKEAGAYKVRQYSHVTDFSPQGIFAALQRSPLAIGVLNFQGKGAHMMAAFDVTEDGKRLLCANWWPMDDGSNVQRVEEVPFEDVEVAISFANADGIVDPQPIPTTRVAWDKVMSIVKYHTKKLITAVLALMASGGAMYGAGYAPVTGYQAGLTQYITAAQTTIPVSSVLDPSGTAININLISSSSTKYMYFNIEPGTPSRQELVACTGISGNNLTGCIRGLSFQGSSLVGDSSRAFPHNPGSKIIMTNTGVFYANEMVTINGDQTVNDIKTFSAFPKTSSTTAIPSTGGQFATKYYVDNVGAGGFTASNVSTTLGLLATGSVPEKVGINASNTTGLGFDSSSGKLYLNVSSTGGLVFDASMSPYGLYFDKTRDYTFTGNLTSAGSLTVNTPTQNAYATNKSYVDYSLQTNSATGTAGENVTAGQALYASSTGALYLADADAVTTTYSFVGIALNTTNTNGVVTYARPGGIVTNQSGLTAGQYYYISGTSGSIVTPGASGKVFARVGFAMSATNMLVMRPTFEQMANGTTAVTYDGTTSTVVLGFVPKEVEVYCIGDTAAKGSSHGYFAWDQSGTASQVSQGFDDSTTEHVVFSDTRACTWVQGAAAQELIIATTTRGFTLSGVGTGVTQNVYWRAKYWDNGFGGN